MCDLYDEIYSPVLQWFTSVHKVYEKTRENTTYINTLYNNELNYINFKIQVINSNLDTQLISISTYVNFEKYIAIETKYVFFPFA